jgi:hypothetical protein
MVARSSVEPEVGATEPVRARTVTQDTARGIVLLLAVAIDRLSRRR